MKKEEQTRAEAEEALSNIDKAWKWLREESKEFKEELDKYKKLLPELLTAWAMGDIRYQRIKEIKGIIRGLEDFLENERPMIEAGLEKLERQANHKRNEARRLAERRTEYEKMKERFRTGEELLENTERIKELRDLAQRLDEQKDCDAFLADIAKPTPGTGKRSQK